MPKIIATNSGTGSITAIKSYFCDEQVLRGIGFPDGAYTPYTWRLDCWTPAGMLSMNLTDSVTIRGNLWEEWHIAPAKP